MSLRKPLIIGSVIALWCAAASLSGEQDRPDRKADEVLQLKARVQALESRIATLESRLAPRVLAPTQPLPAPAVPDSAPPPRYWRKWNFNGQDVYIVPLGKEPSD